jgi:hypothetical protein
MELFLHCHRVHSWHYALAWVPITYFISSNHHHCDLVGFVLIKSKLWKEGDEIGIFVDYCVLEEPVHQAT